MLRPAGASNTEPEASISDVAALEVSGTSVEGAAAPAADGEAM